ncbi:membrane protein implicated in regulation of membrane protease activity [Mycoplasmopsis mustelae]|uniref:Membrane protein implicated in regulation of membrane protease activity n=1 Tax=Mycoplasmopsis mustelae TaxID=171289 RepID=A0A4R7UD27_9BACT|nr:NfeD family protein [Mycoplasmopsis mustelae]TDV24368.1 membrane protein implicated in regulation of membrane protease activity [Mycoplasmopsis mustelae]
MTEILKIVFITFWVAIILLFIILEVSTNGIWFGLTSVAAIPSVLVAIFTKSKWWIILIEFAIFTILWIILYFSFFKLLKNKLKSQTENERLDGLTKSVPNELLEDCDEYGHSDNNYGKIKIDGKYYRTLSVKGQGRIAKGTMVVVETIKGNILYIRKEQ